MSETPSAKSRVDELIAQAQIDDEEEKSHQSQQSRAGDLHEADEDEEESGSDDDNTRVFYKASELIHQPRSVERSWLRKHGKSKYIDFTED